MSIRNIQDPINTFQLENINYNFGYLFNYLRAITAGGDIDQLIAQVNAAVNEANSASDTANEALTDVQNGLIELQNEIDKAQNLKGIGLWDGSVNYLQNNIVGYLGDSYLALVDNTNITPTDSNTWLLVSRKGDQGTGLTIKGKLNNPSELPPASGYNEGDAFYVGQDLYVKISGVWENVGQIKGDPGTDATVTQQSIETALGYNPMNPADFDDFVNNEYDVFKSDVEEKFEELKARPYNYKDFGIAFDSNAQGLPVRDTHASWTHATVSYDEEDDKVIVFYDVKPGHVLSDNRVLMRKKTPYGGIGAPVVVADKKSQGISCKTQAAGIAANGDYLCLVYEFSGVNEGLNVYKSTDKGSTWTAQQVLIGGSPVSAFNGDVTGFLVLKSGRILSLVKQSSTASTLIYSDNNGSTWSYVSVDFGGNTEPAWCELEDGTIISYMRYNVDSNYDVKIPARFTKSTDGGMTWTPPVDSTSILDFTNSNGHLIYHEDTKTVEFLHHSRFQQPDGFSSIYVSVANEKYAAEDNMGDQIRISKLSPHNKFFDGTLKGDSGYIGAAKDKYGNIHAFYYNGSFDNTQICYLQGTKSPTNDKAITLDHNTSQVVIEARSLAPQSYLKWDIGGLGAVVGNPEVLIASTNRLRTNEFINVVSGTSLLVSVSNSNYQVGVHQYNNSNILLASSGWKSLVELDVLPNVTKIKVLLRKIDDSDISAYEVSKNVFDLYRVPTQEGKEFFFYKDGVESIQLVPGDDKGTASRSKGANSVSLILDNPVGQNGSSRSGYVFDDMIDFTNLKRIYVEWDRTNAASATKGSNGLKVTPYKIDSTSASAYTGYVARIESGLGTVARTIQSVDVTSVVGSYYLQVMNTAADNSTVSGSGTTNVYRIWGEN